jgi:large subunit ribosomal protein L25
MKSVSLTAYPRTVIKRGGVKKIRTGGRIPAVIYGRHNPPQNLEIGDRDLENMIHHSASENVLLDLKVDGDPRAKRLALVQEVQHHPLSGKVLHVDLHEVSETEKVTIMVPVEPVGEAVGVKSSGGVLEHVLFRIKARALPKDLPEVIHVDVSGLDIGKSITLGDIQPPQGVEFIGKKEIVVLAVAAPIAEVAETAAAADGAASGAQPEMIKEKKDEAGGAAPAAKAGDKGAAAKAGDKAGGEKKAEKKK